MIDLRLLREDPELFRASQRARRESPAAVDTLLAADESRRSAVAHFEGLRAEQKQLGKQMPKATGADREALLTRTKELSQQVKDAEAAVNAAEADLRAAQFAISNLVEEGGPTGGEDDFVFLREVRPVDSEVLLGSADKPSDFPLRDHLDIGEALGAIDVERGAKVS